MLPDEKGATAAAFLIRASRYFAAHGIKHIERVLSDNAIRLRDDQRRRLSAVICSTGRFVIKAQWLSRTKTARGGQLVSVAGR